MFHYGLKFLKRIDAAFIFSCLYTFYGYRTIDIYHRSAIAEAIALTVIPIVMYYAYALIYEKKPCAIPLAVSMSLLIYTHVLSTFMSVIAVGLLVLGGFVVVKQEKRKHPVDCGVVKGSRNDDSFNSILLVSDVPTNHGSID